MMVRFDQKKWGFFPEKSDFTVTSNDNEGSRFPPGNGMPY